MSLGDRCDEIVRLIDETLADLGLPAAAPTAAPATVTVLATGTGMAVRAGRRADADPVERAVSGF